MDENNFNNQNDSSNSGSQQNYNYSNNSGSYSSPEPFGQPSYGYSVPPVEPEMSLKDWIITLVVLMIPCLNIIMLFVWAFSGTNKTRSNFCKAQLIVGAVVLVLSFVLSAVVGSTMAIFFQEMMRYM